METYLKFIFFVLILVPINATTRPSQPMFGSCPPDRCAENPPTVEDGTIMMTLYYDNDDPDVYLQPDNDVIEILCEAYDILVVENEDDPSIFNIDFKMGSSVLYVPEESLIYCRAYCKRDLLEACASKYIENFPQFACCNRRMVGDLEPIYLCAEEQSVSREEIDACMDNYEGIGIVIGNSDERAWQSELPECYLPDVLFNGRNDRCIKFTNIDELMQVLCAMYDEGGVDVPVCSGYIAID